jgi:hypothetical protein
MKLYNKENKIILEIEDLTLVIIFLIIFSAVVAILKL